MNVPQKPDGTIDDECTYTLEEMAKWIKVCKEGVFGTRPFRAAGEGYSKVHIEGFKEDAVDWTSSDFRFTTKGNTLYAFQMRWPEDNRAVIKSLTPAEKVRMCGSLGGQCAF